MRRTTGAALAAAFAALVAGCTSTQTSSTAPSAAKCQVSVNNAPSSFTASGGTGTMTISTTRDCAWAVSANAGWVTITGATAGQGDASVSYSVAANPVPSARSAAIAVGSQSVSLNEAGAACRFTLSRTSDTVGADGGQLSVAVATLTGCAWTASSSATWLTITSGHSGNANGTVGLRAAANTGAARVAAVNIAGQTYTVNQAASKSAPTPTHQSFSGAVSAVDGQCPALTLKVGGQTVLTNAQTTFTGITCAAIRSGSQISGTGTLDAAGAIHADAITKAGSNAQ